MQFILKVSRNFHAWTDNRRIIQFSFDAATYFADVNPRERTEMEALLEIKAITLATE